MRLDSVASLRDGVLLITALAYGLGYGIVSYFAWRNNVGLMPALDFHYIIAGLAPTVMLCVLIVAIIFVSRLALNAKPLLTHHRSANLAVLLTSCAVMIALIMYNDLLAGLLLPAFFVTVLLTERGSRLYVKFHIVYISILVTMYYTFGLNVFVHVIYPEIPLSFGGVKPQCAFLDLQVGQMSEETLRMLTGSDDRGGEVLQSQQLSILFLTNQTLIVRVASSKGEQILQLHPESIRAIRWCQNGEAYVAAS